MRHITSRTYENPPWSHVVQQTKERKGAIWGDIILEGSSLLILCPTRSLYMRFVNKLDYVIQNQHILQDVGFYVEMVKS